MGTTPITLDFSKAQPVTLDFSKAQKLDGTTTQIPENYGFTASHMLKEGFEGVKQLGSSLNEMAKDLVFPKGDTEAEKIKYLANKYIFDPADREKVLARNAPDAWSSIGHSIASALPLVGPWAAGLGEQAGSGDVGGATARAGSQVAVVKAAPYLAKSVGIAGGMARDAIGDAIHTPEGNLTPTADIAGKVGGGAAGAATGSLVGHEYLGAAAGYKLGPSLLDQMFPESKATAEARTQAADYMQRAEDLMKRGKEQETLDRKSAATQRLTERQQAKIPDWETPSHEVASVSPFAGSTSTAIPLGNQSLPTAGAGIPQGNLTPFVSKFTPPEAARIVTPGSGAPPINKTLVSYSRSQLVEMAKGGDLDALRELIRNPGGIDVKSAVPNSRYLIEANRPTNIYGGPQQ